MMLLGSETPRVFTPPLRELTPATSRGYECIQFADEILGIDLFPWQKWMLIHSLELTEQNHFRFRTVLLMVARQSGKSTLMQVLTLWRMFVDGAALTIGTAQNLDVAEEQWQGAVDMAEAIPELAGEIATEGGVVKTNGKKTLRLASGERYKVQAASRRGARGLSGDLVLLDELREHQNWEAWASVTKTTMARREAQVWAASNAGDASSIVLRHLRTIGHRALGYPDGRLGMANLAELTDVVDESIGMFEWSAAPDRGIWDRQGWVEANPSLGYAIDESTIASAAAVDPEWVFRAEVLCQFVNIVAAGPFPTGAWARALVPEVVRDKKRPVAYCVDVSYDRAWASIAIAFWDTEGRRRVEIAARRAGPDWVIPWLTSKKRKVRPEVVTLQTNGAPVSSLIDAFEKTNIELVPWAGPDLARACGMFYDAIRWSADDDPDGEKPLILTHGIQDVLDIAANTATIVPLGDGWGINRRNSPADAAPLMAVIGAHWLLMSEPQAIRSAYEDDDLVVM